MLRKYIGIEYTNQNVTIFSLHMEDSVQFDSNIALNIMARQKFTILLNKSVRLFIFSQLR